MTAVFCFTAEVVLRLVVSQSCSVIINARLCSTETAHASSSEQVILLLSYFNNQQDDLSFSMVHCCLFRRPTLTKLYTTVDDGHRRHQTIFKPRYSVRIDMRKQISKSTANQLVKTNNNAKLLYLNFFTSAKFRMATNLQMRENILLESHFPKPSVEIWAFFLRSWGLVRSFDNLTYIKTGMNYGGSEQQSQIIADRDQIPRSLSACNLQQLRL